MKTKGKEKAKKTIQDIDNSLYTDISPKLKNIIGVVKLPADFDEKKVLTEYFENKHLRSER
jgi:hypothetical protein